MSMKNNTIGKWLLGIGAAVAFISKQKVTFGVKGVYLNGIITQNSIPLRVVCYLMNKTIIGRLLVRSISGYLVSNGKVIATMDQPVNRVLKANSYIEQVLVVNIQSQEALKALYDNVQTGDVNNLSFELIGQAVIGEQWPVTIKFNKVFTWDEIKTMV